MAKRRSKTWDIARTWKNYLPPARPSKGTVRIVAHYLDKKIKEKGSRIKVLILGSTPEFRSVVISKGLVPNIVDYNKGTFEALRGIIKHKGREKFINQDWRTLRLSETFDIILAEAVVTVSQKKDVPRILENVACLLEPDGYFLSKTWIRFSNERKSMEEILRYYRRYHHGKSFYFITSPFVNLHLYDQKKDTLPLKSVYVAFRRLYADGSITEKEFRSILGLGYETTSLHLYIPLKKDIEKIFSKLFMIGAIRHGESPLGEYTPTYILRKK